MTIKMKKAFSITVAVALLMINTAVLAQFSADPAVLFDETIWSTQKRKVVLDQMDLSEAEKASFWPIYESYTQAISAIETENLQIIVACNDKSAGLSQSDIERYSRKQLQNDLLLDRVRLQYYKRLSKALSPEKASQFMQLDENLRMELRFDIQNRVQRDNEAQASIR